MIGKATITIGQGRLFTTINTVAIPGATNTLGVMIVTVTVIMVMMAIMVMIGINRAVPFAGQATAVA
jgi:hypothetical protein